MDLLSLVFLGCFVFGLAFSLLSFLLGGLGGGRHDAGHTHVHAGHGVHQGGGHVASHVRVTHTSTGHGPAERMAGHAQRADTGDGTHGDDSGFANAILARLSPTSSSMFLCWFGGFGFAAYSLLGLSAVLGFLLAIFGGVLGASLLSAYLVYVLLPGQTLMDPDQVVGRGVIARVSRDIREDGIGEIVFTLGETRHSEGARADDGHAIARGTEVVITRMERGIAYVQPWKAFIGESEAEMPQVRSMDRSTYP